jgi:hypothetical protein
LKQFAAVKKTSPQRSPELFNRSRILRAGYRSAIVAESIGKWSAVLPGKALCAPRHVYYWTPLACGSIPENATEIPLPFTSLNVGRHLAIFRHP